MVRARSSLWPLLSLSLLLLLCASALPVSLAQCVSSALDPAPGGGRALATADNSAYVGVTRDDGAGGMRFYKAMQSNGGSPLLPSSFLLAPQAAACSASLGLTSYAPYYGKSISLAGDLAAIGAPNRLGLSGGSSYSSIDIVSLAALQAQVDGGASASAAYAAAGVVSSISDASTPHLGTLLSLDATGTFLASSFDASTLVVYSPVSARSVDSFHATQANDTKITLPAGFRADSIAINHGVLAVSGLQMDALSTGNCVPYLLTYTYVPATSTNVNFWATGDAAPLLREGATSSASADRNAMPCQLAPRGSLPLDISTDALRIVVGSPQQSCAYAVNVAFLVNNAQELTVHPRCVDSNLYGPRFGADVAFASRADGGRSFLVASERTVTTFSFTEWVNPDAADPTNPAKAGAFYQFPNRMQQGTVVNSVSAGVGPTEGSRYASTGSTSSSRFAALASRGNMTIVAQSLSGVDASSSSVSSAPELLVLLSASAVPAGQQWVPATRSFELCPAGRFSTGSGAGFGGCAFCPPGTYQSAQGQSACRVCPTDSYCPTGSVSPQFSSSSFTPSLSFVSNLPYGEVDLGGVGAASASFNELLVSRVFSVTAWPAMIIFFVLLVGSVLMYLASFWADVDGDEKDCCSSVGNCCLHSYRLLGRFKYFTLGKPGPFPYSRRPVQDQPDVIQYDANGDVHQRGVVVTKPNGTVTTSTRNADGSVTTTTTDALDIHPECAAHEHRSPEVEGFLTLVFILFALSVVCYTGMYLASYDPTNSEGSAYQNIYRTRTEHARLSGDLEPEFKQGIDALLQNAFVLQVSFMGLSAAQGCTTDLLLGLEWDGCTVPSSTPGAANPSCSSVFSASSIDWSSSASYTCVLSLSLPRGVVLAADSSLRLTLPPTASWQALRYQFVQSATNVALSLPAKGTHGSSAHEDNTASIAAGSFTETLYLPDANTRVQHSGSSSRTWLLTPVAYRTLRDGQWSDVYDTVWYAEARDMDTSPLMPSESPNTFLYTAPALVSTVELRVRVSDRWTLKQVQRKLGGQEVLFYIILGVVAIYHLIALAQALFYMAWNLCTRGTDKRRVRVSSTTEPPAPTSLTQVRQAPPESMHVMEAYPPQREQYPLPPIRDVYSSAHSEGGWRYDAAPGSAFPARSMPVTPGVGGVRYSDAGGGMPITPGRFHANPHSTLEEDRARFQAAQRARAAGMTPRSVRRQPFDDDHINVEMSMHRSQRAGFEV